MITVAICCYGLFHEPARSPKELKGLRQYLWACAQYITHLYKEGRLSGVILCGGHTNAAFPHLSEAKTNGIQLKEFLKELGVPPLATNILREELSENTPQNIDETVKAMTWGLYSQRTIDVATMEPPVSRRFMEVTNDSWRSLSHRVVFVCDSCRHLKVEAIIYQLKRQQFGWGMDFNFGVVSFRRLDTHPNSSWWKQAVGALLYYLNDRLVIKALRHPSTFA